MSNFDEFDAKAIIKQYLDGATCSFIAEKRGMAPSSVSRILKTAGVKIRMGRGANSNKDTEFYGKTHGKAGRRCDTLPKLRNARMEAGITAVEISEYLGKYPAWVSLIENGTMRPTSERLEVLQDAITAIDIRNAKTVRAAAEERCIRFRDPDGHTIPYKKRGTGTKAVRKARKVKNAKETEKEMLRIVKARKIRPEMKVRILLALAGIESSESLAA